jgi:hypothetical protein
MTLLFDLAEYDQRTIACDKHLKEISGVADKVVVSVSSGKTSTYLALNKDPEDKRPYHYQFAVVLTSDANARPKDSGLLKECQKRIPWFEASHEVDDSLKIILQLEQELGQEVRWVASQMTFEELIEARKRLPDRARRICTKELKYEPQFWDTYLNLGEGLEVKNNSFIPNPLTVEVQIGYRWDERQRVYRALGLEANSSDCDAFEFAYCCDLEGQFAGNHRWRKADWRIRNFPLYSSRVTTEHIWKYWEHRGWDYKFPEISNCVLCFHKTKEELQRQAILYPERVPNWMAQEVKTGHTFNKEASLQEIIFGGASTESDFMPCSCTD